MILELAVEHASLSPGESKELRCRIVRGEKPLAGAAFVTDDSLVAGLSSPMAMYQAAQDDGTALVTVTNDGKFALEYDRCGSLFYVQLIEQADMISMNQASSEVLASLSDSDRAMVSAFVELGESKNEPNRGPQLDTSARGASGNTGGTAPMGKSFRTECKSAPGSVVIGSDRPRSIMEVSSLSTHEDERQSEKGEGRLHQTDVIGLSDGYDGSVKTPKAGFRWPGSSESGPGPGSASGIRGGSTLPRRGSAVVRFHQHNYRDEGGAASAPPGSGAEHSDETMSSGSDRGPEASTVKAVQAPQNSDVRAFVKEPAALPMLWDATFEQWRDTHTEPTHTIISLHPSVWDREDVLPVGILHGGWVE